MINLLLLPFLINGFIQKWYIPYGTIAPGGRILVYDSDHDGRIELIFRRWIPESFGVYFAEFVPPDSWDIYESIYVDSILVWDAGDFDNDGYADLITDGDALSGGPPIPIISVYESSDSFSYPTQEVWRDTVGPPLVLPISTYDIDQDGFPEIVKNRATPYGYIGIYEATGDNQYELIFADDPDTSGLEAPAATHAFGDFDGDGSIECVFAGGDEWYWVYESPSNNVYEKISEGTVTTLNVRDCFSVPDADEDGKLEFVVKGFVIPSAEIHAFIFEAIADNTYEIVKTFTFPGGDYYGGYSDAGDVDGDSIPEIVLEARQNVFIIKAAGNDSFYIWDTLPGHASGSCVRIFDIDDNGLSEIIISGADETRIYEYDPGGTEEARSRKPEARYRLQVSPNPFKDKLNIRYQIPEKNRVNMKIYNAAGLLVKDFSLYSSGIGGQVSVKVWDGKDNSGQQVPSGVYFARLETPNKSITKKIIKLK